MTKNVRVEVVGIQYLDEIADKTTSVSNGTYYEKKGVHYCFYEHTVENIAHKHILKFDKYKIKMTNRGNANSVMVFDVNKKYHTIYNTPAGPLEIEIFTNSYKYENKDEKIRLDIDYNLTFDKSIDAMYKLTIKIISIDN